MKARISLVLSIVTLIFTVPLLFCGCKKDEGTLKDVTLNEVAHSIFYAPQYVAIENGYFEEEGINLKLVTGFGADKVMTALISGEAQIGFMGSESSIYAYNEGNSDYAVNFAQLTQRAGNFLVSRKPIDNFSWDMLKGTTILGGRAGGMPEMVLEYILKNNEIDISTDLEIVQNIDFGLTGGAFAGGQGDFTVEFEPHATALEKEGTGYVVASLGVDSGYVPYTAYSAKKSYINKNPEIIQGFTNALQRGMEYVNSHSSEDIAKVIAPQFPDTDADTIAVIVERYKSQDTWKNDLVFSKDSFTLLQDILYEAGVIKEYAPYSDLVDTGFAQKALK